MMVRSTELELLDAENIPQSDLFQNLRELERINQLLGGHKLNRQAFTKTLPSKLPETLLVLELASGGGDNLRDLARFCRKKGIQARFIGVDLKPDCVEFARAASSDFHEISFICSDYRAYRHHQPIDIAFSSLFCHHLNEDEILEYLDWNAQYAPSFFINDLHRHSLAEKSITLLTQLFSHSYLVKNDAPASVRRGFKKGDWKAYLKKVNISASITWHWAFRWMLIVKQHGSQTV